MSRPIDLANVSKSFDAVEALDSIDLHLEAGTFTAVVGPSGSGKSTLLRLIGGLATPSSGLITIDGRSPNEVRANKEIGWMAQQPALLPWKTVADNVALAQSLNPRPERSTPDPEKLLAMVGMADFAAAYPASLSGGMQQRVALARTLAVGASVWLMDEPFSALDELTRENLADELLAIWERIRPTVVWVTHHIPEAVKLADSLVLLSPRPSRLVEVVSVDLPRPREEHSELFQNVVGRARAGLRLADAPLGAAG
ncbi:MAG TPA: ABC transporter ATP-binding protein [Acidimicrobiia bacterium]|nr:ABC transporter ATP-binding protein [Acidimicrobiia bacterium]